MSKIYLIRHACGFMSIVQRVYADSQRIVIGLALSGPHGFSYVAGPTPWNFPIILTDAQGHRFPVRVQTFGPPKGTAEGFALEFATHGAIGRRSTITLHLNLSSIQMNVRNPATKSSCVTPETSKWAGYTRHSVIARGPFLYTMTVPVAPTRVVTLYGKAQTHLAKLTLQRLEVTPTNTRIIARIVSAQPLDGLAALAVPGEVYRQVALSRVSLNLNAVRDGGQLFDLGEPNQDHRTWTFNFDAPFFSYHGTTTLVIVLSDWHARGRHRTSSGGTLRLRFTVRFPTS